MSLEYTSCLELDFEKHKAVAAGESVLPVVVQHIHTKEVLILAYVNRLAFEESLSRKIAVFWSTSRQKLWVKGDTSGDYLDLMEVRVNCEQNSLLFLVKPRQGGVCHAKNNLGDTHRTCFYRRLSGFSSTNLELL